MKIVTDYPLADWSPDHIHPKGTATDSSVKSEFNQRLMNLIPGVRLLDLGCAGGGLVASILKDGGFAVGIDGSDYSKLRNRASWATIPGNLFTADITKPFTLEYNNGSPLLFNVVTAWEVFEHIPEPLIDTVLKNAEVHLSPDGLIICSISQMKDEWEGYNYHVTVEDRPWWVSRMAESGWRERSDLYSYFDPYWVRGPQNGMDSFALVLSR